MKLTDAQNHELDQVYDLTLTLNRRLAALRDVAADQENFNLKDYMEKFSEYQSAAIDLGLRNRYFLDSVKQKNAKAKKQNQQ